MVGDGSTLNLDFTTGVLDSRLTFTRGSTGTRINASGFVETMSNNIPRFDHDPTTLAPMGLRIEAQATNLLNWSESFATSGGTNNNWADTSITRTTGQADPANGTTAIQFAATAGNATIISSAAIGTSAARTFSVWLRRVTGTGDIQYTQNNGTNWTTQAITSTWTRYTFTHTVDHRVGIRIVTSGDAIEMWGAMLETGAGASSYIPTGASQGTRNSDSCVMTGTNFSSWYNQSEGTWLCRAQKNVATSGHAFNANTSNNAPRLMVPYTPTQWNLSIETPSGTFPANYSIGTASLGVSQRIAAAFKQDDFAGCVNGGTVFADTSGAMTTGLNTLQIGAAEGGYQFVNGTIALLKYWPTRLPNAQLQSLTT
jgi:hypothetical protein